MKQGKISATQLVMLVFACKFMATMSYYGPDTLRHNGVVVNCIYMALTAIAIIPALMLSLRRENDSITQSSARYLGRGGAVVNTLYYIYILFFGMLSLVSSNFLIVNAIFPEASTIIISAVFFAVCVYGASLGLESIARVSLFAVVLIIFELSFLFAALSNQIELINLTAAESDTVRGVFETALLKFGDNSDTLVLLMLLPRAKGSKIKGVAGFLITTLLIYEAVGFLTITVLGQYAETLLFPVYALSGYSGISVFRNISTAHLIVWVFVAFIKTSVYLIIANDILRQILPKKIGASVQALNAAVIFILGTFVASSIKLTDMVYQPIAYAIAALLLLTVIPGMLLMMSCRRRKSERHTKRAIPMILTCLIFFTGCTNMRGAELTDIILAQQVGIDYKDGEYEITVQIFNPGSSGKGVDVSKPNALVLKGSGDTISEAMHDLNLRQGRDVFYRQTRIFVIGEELAQKGLDSVASYINSNVYNRPNHYIVIANGCSAADIVSEDINQGIIPADSAEKAIDYNIKQGIIPYVRALDFMKYYHNRDGDFVLPAIFRSKVRNGDENNQNSGQKSDTPGENKGEDQGGEDEESVSADSSRLEEQNLMQLEGGAVFKGGRLVGWLDRDEIRGLTWWQNTAQNTSIQMSTDTIRAINMDVFRSRSKVTVDARDGRADVTVRIKLRAQMGEPIADDPFTADRETLDSIAKAMDEHITEYCQAAFAKCLEYGINPLRMNNVRVKGNAQQWQELNKKWQDGDINVRFEVTTKLNRLNVNKQ